MPGLQSSVQSRRPIRAPGLRRGPEPQVRRLHPLRRRPIPLQRVRRRDGQRVYPVPHVPQRPVQGGWELRGGRDDEHGVCGVLGVQGLHVPTGGVHAGGGHPVQGLHTVSRRPVPGRRVLAGAQHHLPGVPRLRLWLPEDRRVREPDGHHLRVHHPRLLHPRPGHRTAALLQWVSVSRRRRLHALHTVCRRLVPDLGVHQHRRRHVRDLHAVRRQPVAERRLHGLHRPHLLPLRRHHGG
mmetsp:Transcript_34064/g.81170  ORF Transcript_34064/g.81170 Transcript_34064/m.81170 type:complete len:239 (+) Transcript_34064:2268-2984(+)